MPPVKRIKLTGRIIRIVDTSTVIINLGTNDGITEDSVFFVRGIPEAVIDPVTGEKLGEVAIVKAKLKAAQVFAKFTIATSKWEQVKGYTSATGYYFQSLVEAMGRETVQVGRDLRVKPEEIQDWKAKTEEPVRLGDAVEVTVRREVTDDDANSTDKPKQINKGN